jgi:hypothetical protein
MTKYATLEFELKALKSVLESQKSNRDSYHRSYLREFERGKGQELQGRASLSVWREYTNDVIPRTERHIEALEWALYMLKDEK